MVTKISKANAEKAVACYDSHCSRNDDETTALCLPHSLPQQAHVLSPAPPQLESQQHHSLCKADQYNLLPLIDLDDDMEFLCQTMRINDNTRVLLTYFDAGTVEDFALMTPFDFRAMMEHSARFGRPFPPLQQRKVAVLSKWLREMMQQTCRRHNRGPFVEKEGVDVSEFRRFTISAKNRRESECRQAKKGDDHDGSDSTSDTTDDIEMMTSSQRFQANKDDEIYSLLPPNWKEEFQTDLPRLKANLCKEGEERSRWSACTEAVLSLRWIISGHND